MVVAPVPALSARQAAFAREYVECLVAVDAYRAAYGIYIESDVSGSASRVLAMPAVRAEIERLSKPFGHGKSLLREQIKGFLHDVVTTPVGEVDEFHPLAQKVKRVTTTNKDGDQVETVTVEMPGKLEAAMASAKLDGMLIERVVNTHTHMPLGSVLAGLCGVVHEVPAQEVMSLPDDEPQPESMGELW